MAIMRTFVRLRQLLSTHEDLARRLDQLEWRQNEQGQQIQSVFETIHLLIEEPSDENKRPDLGLPNLTELDTVMPNLLATVPSAEAMQEACCKSEEGDACTGPPYSRG